MQNDDLVNDVDITKRYDNEWEDIYHIKIIKSDYINNSKLDEFEWCYFLMNSTEYQLIPNYSKHKDLDYSIPEEMETRAMKINRDIFSTADKHEKKILEEKRGYMPTKYILNYRCKK